MNPKEIKNDSSTTSPNNASNPDMPNDQNSSSIPAHQLLNNKAEKYLREGGNIEDMPDSEDENAADDETKQNTNR